MNQIVKYEIGELVWVAGMDNKVTSSITCPTCNQLKFSWELQPKLRSGVITAITITSEKVRYQLGEALWRDQEFVFLTEGEALNKAQQMIKAAKDEE